MTHALLIHHGSTQYLRDLLQESGKEFELSVITEQRFADEYPAEIPIGFVPSVADLTAVRAAALELNRRSPIDRVVSGTERTQQASGYLRSLFGLPGMGYDQANLFSNKLAMKSALRIAGLPVADFRAVYSAEQLTAAAAELGWPVVVKPAIGQGTMDTYLLHSPAQLSQLLRSPAATSLLNGPCPILVERFVEMDTELHCDGVIRSGTVEFVSVCRYLRPLLLQGGHINGSYFLPDDHALSEPARQLHAAVVKALGLEAGVTHLELFASDGDLTIGEIACRPAGGAIPDSIRMRHGIDLRRTHVDIALGRPATAPQPRENIRGILVNCLMPVRPGRISRLSGAADLAAVPDLVRVDILSQVGDLVRGPLYSAACSAHVFFDIAHEDLLPHRLRTLSESFVYDVEPELTLHEVQT